MSRRVAFTPELTPNVVHVYDFRLTESFDYVTQALARLDDTERSQAERFATATLKRRYVVSHARLRETLAQYLALDACAIRFSQSEFGKPALDAVHSSEIKFNLSHSGERCAIAITRDTEVGIDVELNRPLADWRAIASRFFSELESCALEQLPECLRERAFFGVWTRKEAYIKALGVGLSLDLAAFAVEVDPLKPARLLWARDDLPSRFWLADFDVGAEYCGAVACPGSHFELIRCSAGTP
jgi:4'-phosphopantetheinyl transferase